MDRNKSLVESGYLNVSNLHSIYYEIHGNKEGIPVFIVHGGPGGGSSYKNIKLFDLKKYKLVFFDQRGCGQSIPRHELEENNTDELIEDIEKLKQHLKLEKIILFGGSWGTTLSLLYAIKYPENVLQMILRAIFLARKKDVDFLYKKNGASEFNPDYYKKFCEFVKLKNNQDILQRYYEILKDKNNGLRKEVAKVFSDWESSLASIGKYKPRKRLTEQQHNFNIDISLLEAHYFVNNSFLKENNFILKNTKKIENIKTIIVHGRQDHICLPSGAFQLFSKLKNAKLFLVDKASHSTWEKSIEKILKKEIQKITNEINKERNE
ncbi:prolyl aminopeptidase [Mesomycoplasma lagogenitalium]|uniref:Proline iminopeptidase n=1 Tax=Mesomycoplasma lagogenitalium TaxID=171286 RepID=A0ABY8LX83_9BACT|nr:prolyl aminopeptidase [Mesomycoplasma lagogenitalium]WGI36732.1 prolyl aminopeptidase [Mesomycoplasma lagogenitalium]